MRYLTDVLGIHELLIEPSAGFESQKVGSNEGVMSASAYSYLIDENTEFSFRQVPPFLVLHFESDPSSSIFRDPQKDLFRKMLLALKLSPQQILALEVRGVEVKEMLHDVSRKIKTPIRILVFTQTPSTVPEEKLGLHMIYQTFSPKVLLERPELKKASWELMQKFRGST